MYAVVDVETTGGYPKNHRITEIGIVLLDAEGNPEGEWHSLFNPVQPIPLTIQALTGITPEMVAHQPLFEDSAHEVLEILQGRTFVAHNVNFDFHFVKAEFSRAGLTFDAPKLCTVKLGRKAFAGLRSYSLSSLVKFLNLQNPSPHRALSDAWAAAGILQKVMETSPEKVGQMLKRDEIKLPVNLNAEEFHALPDRPGVYYFKDERGNNLYIGKAKNLKKRVASHLTSDHTAKKTQRLFREVAHIDFVETVFEELAAIVEDHEIRHYRPPNNRAQKHGVKTFNVVAYRDQNQNYRLAIVPGKAGMERLAQFYSLHRANDFLARICREFCLIPELCGLPKFAFEDADNTQHNQTVQELLDGALKPSPPRMYFFEGREPNERLMVFAKNDTVAGFCFVDADTQLNDPESFLPSLKKVSPSSIVASYSETFLANLTHRAKVIEMPQDGYTAF